MNIIASRIMIIAINAYPIVPMMSVCVIVFVTSVVNVVVFGVAGLVIVIVFS